MKDILRTIRNEFIIQPGTEPTLERRIFRLLCLTITFISIFVLVPANYLQHLPWGLNFVITLMGCGVFLLYLAALKGKQLNKTLLVMLLLTINAAWFLNGGSNGSVPYFFFPICMYPLIIFRGWKRWVALVGIIVDGCVLINLSYLHPELVIPYKSALDRDYDLMTGLVISVLSIVLVTWVVLDSYMRERERLEVLNRKMAHEVAERMRREDDIRRMASEHRLILYTIPTGIIYVKNHRVQWVNPAYEKMFGYSLHELLGMDAALHYASNADFVRVEVEGENRPGSEDVNTTEVRMKKKDRSTFWCSITSYPVNPDRPEEGFIRMLQDITESKRTLEELLKAQKLESLGVLAGGIAHDFNNLLTGIMGNISLAKTRLAPGSATWERLDQSERAVFQASKLTMQLLTFAKGGEPVRKLIEVDPIIRDATSFSLRGSMVRGVVEIAEGLWCAEADSGQLNQVLHNLLFNAAQSMENGGEVKILAVNLSLPDGNALQLPAGAYLKISIEDQGCGIPPENLNRIFDPYFTTKRNGSGLGLSSVYSILKKHGGAVDVSSVFGGGSCFSIYLPASPKGVQEAEESPVSSTAAGSGNILIMDDDEFVRDAVASMLEAIGYSVVVCADGSEAVEHFRNARDMDDPFSAVILDLTVPGGMGGKEAVKLIRDIDEGSRIIVSSGYSSDPVIANFQQFGFNGAIIKPYNIDKVATELQRCLSSGEARA